jgi:hypothetical protein
VTQRHVRYSVAANAVCMNLIQKFYLTDRVTNERTAYYFVVFQSLTLHMALVQLYHTSFVTFL